MKEFNVNTDLFGRYAKIPTGFNHELHTYKIESERFSVAMDSLRIEAERMFGSRT